ncbi:hypothetical protein GH810_12860 [Acetobacterium paludosum]|uniref:Bacterial Pleckstrin homology domain-containing protein n=1 Tax=Acetobacterium paludosum TaxID=52693 RepID=A0A923KX62_9FIRM|nr:PH domain-containing protein [Acetobacterium paludosum]MBC3889205.1 hypothetical protein [Acetobacterium paludosum]
MNYSVSLLSTINPLFFAALALVGLLLGKAIYTYKAYHDLRGKAIREIVLGSLVLIFIIAAFIVLPVLAGITVNENNLSLRLPSGLTYETIPKEDILSATVINLDEHPEYAIKSKVVGAEIRHYREGIFNLENGIEATAFYDDNTVLLVQTTNRTLLLGPDHFADFVKNFGDQLISVEP